MGRKSAVYRPKLHLYDAPKHIPRGFLALTEYHRIRNMNRGSKDIYLLTSPLMVNPFSHSACEDGG